MQRRTLQVFVALAALLLALATVFAPAPAGEQAALAAPGDFRLPYAAGLRILTLQGQNQGSHLGVYNRYAYDFAMGQRDDTPFLVLAARSGTVTQVVQGYDTGRDCDPSLTGRGNSVLLDHGDKIGSIYLHLLKNSAVVKVGDRVEQGQPLGRSGRTGYVCGVAHLHFTVVQLPNMMGLDIPFGDPSLAAEGGRPKTNGWYPSSNAQTGPVMLAPLRYQIFVPFMARRAPRP